MTSMQQFEALHEAKLEIGSRVTIDKQSEFANEWDGEYIVTGIAWDREQDTYNITLAEPANLRDGGTDGWELDELRLAPPFYPAKKSNMKLINHRIVAGGGQNHAI